MANAKIIIWCTDCMQIFRLHCLLLFSPLLLFFSVHRFYLFTHIPHSFQFFSPLFLFISLLPTPSSFSSPPPFLLVIFMILLPSSSFSYYLYYLISWEYFEPNLFDFKCHNLLFNQSNELAQGLCGFKLCCWRLCFTAVGVLPQRESRQEENSFGVRRKSSRSHYIIQSKLIREYLNIALKNQSIISLYLLLLVKTIYNLPLSLYCHQNSIEGGGWHQNYSSIQKLLGW